MSSQKRKSSTLEEADEGPLTDEIITKWFSMCNEHVSGREAMESMMSHYEDIVNLKFKVTSTFSEIVIS